MLNVGKVFKLKLNGDAPENQPLEMVRAAYGWSEGWEYCGTPVKGIQTGEFKLVEVDRCEDLDEVIRRISAPGITPSGQWLNAIAQGFSFWKIKRLSPIGIPDPSWIPPHGTPHFPFISTNGAQKFTWANHIDASLPWLWLMQVRKSSEAGDKTGIL